MQCLPVVPSLGLQISFAVLAIGIVFAFGLAARSAGLLGMGIVWATLTAALAHFGWFADFTAFPPRAALLLGVTALLIALVAVSTPGTRLVDLPVQVLIGFQAFRICVEVLIHQAVVEGVAPVQPSWDGWNLDIVTGITALPMMIAAKRCPRWLILGWNSMGLMLVLSVVIVAVVSMPTQVQLLRPDNVWIAFFPFVWLPSILVFAAVLGHLLLYRKLLGMQDESD